VTVSLRRLEIGVAIALFVLGAFATWEATRMPFGSAAMPGPGMLPFALGVLLMLATAGLVVLELKSPARLPDVTLGNRHVALTVAAILVAGLVFESVGFLVTSTLFLWVMLVALSTLGAWRSLLASIAASVAAWYFFQKLLGVNLPVLPFAT
jgi:putative tricarboxylic transport membrane protein